MHLNGYNLCEMSTWLWFGKDTCGGCIEGTSLGGCGIEEAFTVLLVAIARMCCDNDYLE